MPASVALALDLGTSRIKAGLLDAEGRLRASSSAPAPPLAGGGAVREGDPEAYAEAARAVLDGLRREAPGSAVLGLASQRSTFLLWDPESGRPITPLVSWQDRRAAGWCRRHRSLEADFVRRTGLLLSPHYAAPKLAAILEEDARVRAAVAGGRARFGTLETWLLWRWSGGRVHRTDLTMAARTLLADPFAGGWSEASLEALGLPRAILPPIERTAGCAHALGGGLVLGASVADQAAGALAVLGDASDAALVSLGTGCFVVLGTGATPRRVPRYLTAPILGGTPTLFAIEGTVNAGGPVVARFGPGPTPLPERDPAPEGFCLPDAAGVGAPHWSPETPFALSEPARALPPPEARRVVLEGIVFRVREILEDLAAPGLPTRILLAGGLSREGFVAEGLAACLARPVGLAEEAEATLVGAGRLAAGLPPAARLTHTTVRPGARGAYLPAKYARWRAWMLDLGLGRPAPGVPEPGPP